MSDKALWGTKYMDSSSRGKLNINESAPSRKHDLDMMIWKQETSLLETNKFASLFYLLNEFEFQDCKPAAVAVAQAKQCSDKCNYEKSRCFVAIQFLCKKKSCPEFLNICCAILDKFTNLESNSFSDYLRHAQWKRLSSLRPLEAFQETVIMDLIDSFIVLIQNRRIVLEDWASRTICRFLVNFYKCMLLYMYLLKEQEKRMRAKHLKSILDQRRHGLKASLETSIAPLFDPNSEISGKSNAIWGGQEFMTCINSDELLQIDERRDKSLESCFFCVWSRRTSFKRLSNCSIVHSLMKLLQEHCRRWAHYVSKSKTSRFLLRVCRDYVNKRQQCLRITAFQKWRQLKAVSEKVAKIVKKKMINVFSLWIRITAMQKRLNNGRKMSKIRTFQRWRAFVSSKASAARSIVIWAAQFSGKKSVSALKANFEGWRAFVTSKVLSAKLIVIWSAQFSAKIGMSALTTIFQGWKRWYLARWIAKSHVDRSRKTRALNAWIAYQIVFIQKMITCATRVRFLIETNCIDNHFLKWKMRTASKQHVKLTVVIQKMRIRLRMWNRKCGFGAFKTGPIMTVSTFCFNRWRKVSKDILIHRQALIQSSELSWKKKRCVTHFETWKKAWVRQQMLKEKVQLFLLSHTTDLIVNTFVLKFLQKLCMDVKRSRNAAFFVWRNFLSRFRKFKLIVHKQTLFFTRRMFSHLKVCCKQIRMEFMLQDLAKAMKHAAAPIQHLVMPASDSSTDNAHKHSMMNTCFHKWRHAVKDHRKMYFLETMFRCGEINSMRRHFHQWKRWRQ